jgi:hypothetical protein
MAPAQLVVAVARDHQRRNRRDPPAEQAQHVEGRLVRPVQVVQDDDHAPVRLSRTDHRRGDLVRLGAGRHEVPQLAAGLLGDVDEGAQRAGRVQRVAGAPPDLGDRLAGGAEMPQQRRLAGAGVTREQNEPAPALPGRRQRLVQRGELVCTFEQAARRTSHRLTLAARRSHVHGPVAKLTGLGPTWAILPRRGLAGRAARTANMGTASDAGHSARFLPFRARPDSPAPNGKAEPMHRCPRVLDPYSDSDQGS